MEEGIMDAEFESILISYTVQGFRRGFPVSIQYQGLGRACIDQFRPFVEEIHAQGIVTAFDSPLEELFYHAWYARCPQIDLTYQYEVLDGKYRFDFAHLPTQTAIELDGYAWHSSKEQFTKDRQRQRDLERHGWRFIRFSGQEVVSDVGTCIDEVLSMLPGHTAYQ